LQRERQSLGRGLLRYAGASLLTEIALRFAASSADRELFEGLRQGLDHLVDEDVAVETLIFQEAWKLIERLGFAPSIDRCSLCDRPTPAEQPAHFDLIGGGMICGSCRPSVREVKLRGLTATARTELAGLLSGGRPSNPVLATAATQRELLRDFIAYHLADHRALNSFRFLEERLQ
jgi:recombinational DNA repair protein (RecF pathway)